MYCPRCGNKIADTSKSCQFCGYEITENDVLDVTPSTKEGNAKKKGNNQNIKTKSNFSLLNYFWALLAIICYPVIIFLYINFGLSTNFYLSIGVVLLITLLSSYMLGTTNKELEKIQKISKLIILISLIVICGSIALFLYIGYDDKETLLDKIDFSLILISALALIQSLVLSLLTKRK